MCVTKPDPCLPVSGRRSPLSPRMFGSPLSLSLQPSTRTSSSATPLLCTDLLLCPRSLLFQLILLAQGHTAYRYPLRSPAEGLVHSKYLLTRLSLQPHLCFCPRQGSNPGTPTPASQPGRQPALSVFSRLTWTLLPSAAPAHNLANWLRWPLVHGSCQSLEWVALVASCRVLILLVLPCL